MTCTPRRKASTDLLYLNGKQSRRVAILHQCDSFILTETLSKQCLVSTCIKNDKAYKGGDAEFVVTKQQASCLGWSTT